MVLLAYMVMVSSLNRVHSAELLLFGLAECIATQNLLRHTRNSWFVVRASRIQNRARTTQFAEQFW